MRRRVNPRRWTGRRVGRYRAVRVAATLAATLMVLGSTGPGSSAAIILDALAIRVYDSAGVLAADRTVALKDAAAILARADLDVAWVVCTARREGHAHPACDTAPAPQELVVRLVYSSPIEQDSNRRAFGYTLIDAASGVGTLSTVYVDRVDWLAATGKSSRAQMLGRAIAHELGHLILGSNNHASRGLMREVWTAEEIVRNRTDDWQFTSAQRASLRARWIGGPATGRRASSHDPRPGGAPGS